MSRESELAASPPPTQRTAQEYADAGRRENTERSYVDGVRHFELAWGGLLPATPVRIADYLAHYAPALSHNTLRSRLAALAHWHAQHGFADPTRAPLVRATLKGIRAVHHVRERRAQPLQLHDLSLVAQWAEHALIRANADGDVAAGLRVRRDRALILLGFWRGFRGDELLRLRVEDLTLVPEQGMRLYLARSKTDRAAAGTVHAVPALSRLCPVAAVQEWCRAAGLVTGPLFAGINRHGTVRPRALHRNSLIGVLQRAFVAAGLLTAQHLTAHSLRRGFAGWATGNGWDARALMEYVGWKDIGTAMRYIDDTSDFGAGRFADDRILTLDVDAQGTSQGCQSECLLPGSSRSMVFVGPIKSLLT